MSERVTTRRPAAKKAAPKPAAAKRRRGRPPSKATVMKKIRERVEEKLSGDDVKATLGDYIRLVQLEKELTDEQPREIKVTWVEPKTEG